MNQFNQMNLRFNYKNYLNIFRHPLLGANPWALIKMCLRLQTFSSPHFFLKWIFVFIVSILNTPLILIDWCIGLFRKKNNIEEPIFIIGHPRSGTTFLHELMMNDEQFYTSRMYEVLFPNYARTYGVLFKYVLQPFLPKKRPQDNVNISLNSPQEEEFGMAARTGLSFLAGFYFPKKFQENMRDTVEFENVRDKKKWQKSFKKYVQTITKGNKKQLLLKSPANIARIDAILEIFPNAKFIHIHRHPEETFQSTLHLFEKVLPQTSFQVVDSKIVFDNAFYMYEQFYMNYFNQYKNIPQKNIVEVEFKSLKENTKKTIVNIYKSINLNVSNQFLLQLEKAASESSKYTMNKHNEMNLKNKEKLKITAKRVFENYKYS